VNLFLAILAVSAAIWLRPWRALHSEGPPWLWLAAGSVLPLLWGLDRFTAVSILPSMSGAALLVLLAGWPLAVLAFVPAAVVLAVAGDLSWVDALQRLVWLGVVPATLVLGIGAATRRWLPNHLFVYILGRGFFGTFVATMLASGAALWLDGGLTTAAGDPLVARLLLCFTEALLTGFVTGGLVAFRPQCLATYTDRLYLPR
jgi:uncharacterized membrane protein